VTVRQIRGFGNELRSDNGRWERKKIVASQP
jgi:hypothetical protein